VTNEEVIAWATNVVGLSADEASKIELDGHQLIELGMSTTGTTAHELHTQLVMFGLSEEDASTLCRQPCYLQWLSNERCSRP
jgi:hypothetical protein